MTNPPPYSRPRNAIANIIFASRWLQLPIYLGLIVVQLIYAYKFMKGLWHLLTEMDTLADSAIMLAVLNLIDVVMIANLLLMVIIGGYETFVSKLNTEDHPDQPEWLNHVNASVLKVKLSMAIISISSIHLLQTFINTARYRRRKSSGKSFCTSPSCSRRWRWLTLTKSSTATTTPPNLITKDLP